MGSSLSMKRAVGPGRHHLLMDHDAELDAIAAELVAASRLIVATEDGHDTYTLTPEGARIARQMVMSSEGERLELPTSLLEAMDARVDRQAPVDAPASARRRVPRSRPVSMYAWSGS